MDVPRAAQWEENSDRITGFTTLRMRLFQKFAWDAHWKYEAADEFSHEKKGRRVVYLHSWHVQGGPFVMETTPAPFLLRRHLDTAACRR